MDIEGIGELEMDMTSSAASSVVMYLFPRVRTDSTIIFKNSNLRLGKDGIHPITENVSTYSSFHIEPKQIQVQVRLTQQCEVIGRGASSVVYRALFHKDGVIHQTALKTINAFEKDKREQIINDLRTFFSGCSCPNMVNFYGCYYQQGRINQVIEFMDLGSVRSVIGLVSSGKLKIPESVLASIAAQIANGLMYIHFTKNLIHRDIKPENVLLNSRGEVKITDFGISKHLGKTQGIANTFVGTIIYMSPERILNKKYSHNCDVWSFGLMMYELATGLNPYKFDKEKAPLARVVQVLQMEAPKLDESFSPQFRHFVGLCLFKDPAQRCSTNELIAHPWILKHAQSNDLPGWLRQQHQLGLL